ncbi:S1 RNA-binding domain-containing protein [Aminivibrio sp.]|jgi:small subunit ribosomal protein S1|uniref:S1 RNA-binding domain-containing protein n=1 Tax=Aminivibrio sp. TaxID=1872489 RepID=UPI001A3CCBDA|nr:S1 RNA-binding domain-containing protein [Aminivibrio sp.]MBL3539302.1 S1 RNA-binding domain-containing protein [Aminivibrio sp.]MDK2959052.1 small subunit ribosomal protein [Synergistaceae bacterium]
MTEEMMIEGLSGESGETTEMESMESILEQYGEVEELHRGKVVTGTVVNAVDGGWLVDVGYKCEGFLPAKEWSHKVLVEDSEEPAPGDKIQIQVVSIRHGEEAQLLVSRWRCEFDRRWTELENKLAQNEVVSVTGLRKVKGGLMVECCGLEGFVPISHLAEEGRGVNPGKFVGEVFEAKLMEKDKKKHRLVFSRRLIVEESLMEEREKFYADVQEGTILDGEVSSITSFGVFVNVGPMDGLVHMSELSWKRNIKPKEMFKKGDPVKVKVIGIDREANRLSLSMKQIKDDPWMTAADRWKPQDKTRGVVTNVTDFGAFVEVEPGIEGLIHIGDLSWTRIKHPRDVLRKGQEVDVVVLDVDMEKKRMSLGYKQLNDPWNNVLSRYSKDQDLTVKVVRLADFGAFVEVEEGVEGLIHISQLSTKRVEKPQDVLSEGQEVVARIIEINPADRRMRLSISALEEPAQRRPRDDDRKKGRQDRREHDNQMKPVMNDGEASVTIGELFRNSMQEE